MSDPVPAPGPTTATPALALTGERTLPGIDDERYWFERHVVAYAEVARTVSGTRVLDAGCGEGYGLALLRRGGATEVTGADLDPSVVAHITATYAVTDPAIRAVEAELGDLPLPSGAVDTAVSFQVIEHLWDIPAYLAELRRVVRPGGTVWIATPNRLTFTPDGPTPVNPFHVVEFTGDELVATLVDAGLVVERVLGVHHADRLRAAEQRLGRPLGSALGDGDPSSWPAWLRELVHEVRAADDFVVRAEHVDASLDLLVRCRVPGGTRRNDGQPAASTGS